MKALGVYINLYQNVSWQLTISKTNITIFHNLTRIDQFLTYYGIVCFYSLFAQTFDATIQLLILLFE
jgi:hypothetical protein